MSQPLILIDPLTRALDVICDHATRAKLNGLGQLVIHESAAMPNDMVERHLPEAIIIWGQTNLPRERLFKAKKLKATINVETNLIDNIDYYYCFANSIHVPTSGSAFVDAVADTGLILKGLPPVVCRKAMLETVKRFRSKPVSIT